MDVRLFLGTFAAIFLAELGDKTQLATMALSGSRSARWTIFLASATALVCSSALAVLAGGFLARHVSPLLVQRAAGGLFLVFGVWLLVAAR